MAKNEQYENSRTELKTKLNSLRNKINVTQDPRLTFIDNVEEVLRNLDRISEHFLSRKYKLANDICNNFNVLVEYQLKKANETLNTEEKSVEASAEDSKKSSGETEEKELNDAIEKLTNIADDLPVNLKKSLQIPLVAAVISFGIALTFAFIISGLAGAPEFTSMALGFRHFLFDLGEFFTHAVAGAPGHASVAITATISTAFAMLSTVFCGMAVQSGFNNYRKTTLFGRTRDLLDSAQNNYNNGLQQSEVISKNAPETASAPEDPELTNNNKNNL